MSAKPARTEIGRRAPVSEKENALLDRVQDAGTDGLLMDVSDLPEMTVLHDRGFVEAVADADWTYRITTRGRNHRLYGRRR